jgi:TolB-like protein
MSLFEELKRRNVFRVGVAYVVMAWLLAQVADLFLENFNAPQWVIQSVLVLLVIGFPLALFLAWAFELTPDGVKKEKDVDRSQSITTKTGRKLDFTIIALLAMGLLYFIWESRFAQNGELPSPDRATPVAEIASPASTDANAADTEISSAPAEQIAIQPAQNSIAVLPFVNMSRDEDNEFFSDGVSEEILNVLARIPELKVAARTSAFAYKGTQQNISEIARELKVANVLEGSVRKVGDQVRVTAQLIKADDGFHIWSQTYDRKLDNIFAIQDEIANAIAEALKVTLDLESGASGNLTGTNSLEAYEHYLQGMALWHLRTPDSLFASIEAFEQAIAIDPEFARAHAGRALAYVVLPGYISYDDEVSRSRTLESANRALQLDPDLAEALTVLGQLASDLVQVEEARAYFDRSLELNPSLATTYQWYARLLSSIGDLDAALKHYERARDLDPRSRIIAYNQAWDLMRRGLRDQALDAIRTTLES